MLRRAAAALLIMERNFRKLMRYQDLWMLKTFLDENQSSRQVSRAFLLGGYMAPLDSGAGRDPFARGVHVLRPVVVGHDRCGHVGSEAQRPHLGSGELLLLSLRQSISLRA
ncbi:MAG: hypothetical protein DMG23_00625 [Acidobacteria bacterium]|nr:MAG: hypothetical protein DMG23_00625 [Acidobacteriota bacterium]